MSRTLPQSTRDRQRSDVKPHEFRPLPAIFSKLLKEALSSNLSICFTYENLKKLRDRYFVETPVPDDDSEELGDDAADPFKRIVMACHAAYDLLRFEDNDSHGLSNEDIDAERERLIAEVEKHLGPSVPEEVQSLTKSRALAQLYKLRLQPLDNLGNHRKTAHRLCAGLSFLLSFYSVVTTSFVKGDDERCFLIYLHPIRNLTTAGEKKGMFLVAFSFENGQGRKAAKPQQCKGILELLSELLPPFFEAQSRIVFGADVNAALDLHSGQAHVRFEDTLRRCSRFADSHRTDPHLNRARVEVLQALANKLNTDSEDEPDTIAKDPDLIPPLKVLTGASDRYCSFLRQLLATAAANFRSDQDGTSRKTSDGENRGPSKAFQGGTSIFLYSPPGCGKETLAKLVHLVARTSLAWKEGAGVCTCPQRARILSALWGSPDPDENSRLNQLNVRDSDFTRKAIKDALARLRKHDGNHNDLESQNSEDFIKSWFGGPGLEPSPYFSINCALLSAEAIERLLYGYAEGGNAHEELAGLRQVAFLVGTAFLDEVNTLPKGVENKLLRLLASPYEGMMYENQQARAPSIKIEGLNVLYVFASNARPEELIKSHGLNSAFVGRIRQNYFEIPPLRERPEDVALALSCFFQKRYNDSPTITRWRRIDQNAFRFLCMLPWEDNLRELQGFVDALSLRRQIRGTVEEEEINFEEVIDCAVRRNLISGR